ncbi:MULTISPECIES: Sec-independent protein translocase protein TatB [unclassified Rhodococcus (in: high G+C Gram-positive bacteria)]|uniref:Sec-independent protein translocase protein TatB n=1 Tax=unclassified Rhodococcus (in: high G+C Gram-positive bacteria) TaxID=192944 RepID=UPI00163AB288|nr:MULTISPECIES: Sec-independent protein translocase protein TatB [unclassified Rhodococcus (in: high G+C Gram-positive bacteria)]MBC2638246.1 Sec-independent protein translocase subunit TatB [Rhodococcus sp. 3A]MBC2897012.1 Sec-independent protein translocase subunit TatB [Rhodococcus sp. 4CII]
MFDNLGWDHLMILAVAALVIFGPERLPGALHTFFGVIRSAREYATNVQQLLTEELGPEFDELRRPLTDMQQLRGLTPRAVIAQHLRGGDAALPESADPHHSVFPSTGPEAAASNPATAPSGGREAPPYDTDAT